MGSLAAIYSSLSCLGTAPYESPLDQELSSKLPCPRTLWGRSSSIYRPKPLQPRLSLSELPAKGSSPSDLQTNRLGEPSGKTVRNAPAHPSRSRPLPSRLGLLAFGRLRPALLSEERRDTCTPASTRQVADLVGRSSASTWSFGDQVLDHAFLKSHD